MSFYADMAATARDLLAEFGTSVTIKRTTGATYDPVTGATTAGTTTTHTPNGVFQRIRRELIDGTRIQAGDKLVVIDDSFAPAMTDKIVIDGADWSIEEITPSDPAGTPLVYFVRVRQ